MTTPVPGYTPGYTPETSPGDLPAHAPATGRNAEGGRAASSRVGRVGCVSYLNAKPLIDGLTGRPGVSLILDVPSRLLALLERGKVDLALCPVVDYYRSAVPLELVPVGGIGCCGPTLTVKLFSRVPLDAIQSVHVDPDSHTSVVLMKLVLWRSYGLAPRVMTSIASEPAPLPSGADTPPQAMLLIGDKVVTDRPVEESYPYDLDLGEAWHALTGLPFVFAVWMARVGGELGDLPTLLRAQLQFNLTRLEQIASRYAPEHGWDEAWAHHYLSGLMRYEIGPLQLRAIDQFAMMAHGLGLINRLEPVRLRASGE